MRLTLPLINKLLIPKIIPKKEFTKYGINPKNIIPYNTIDASVIIQRETIIIEIILKIITEMAIIIIKTMVKTTIIIIIVININGNGKIMDQNGQILNLI